MAAVGARLCALLAAVSLWLPRPAVGSACGPFEGSVVFKDASWVKAQVDAGTVTLIDTRDGFDGHVTGAVHATWKKFVQGAFGTPTAGLLQEDAALRSALQALGVSPAKTVVVYGLWEQAWGEEGRIHWMLKYLGHPNAYILAGGLQVYAAAYPQDITSAETSIIAASAWDAVAYPVVPDIRATKEELARGSLFLVDVREVYEYNGMATGLYMVAQDGHIEGAISYPIVSLFQGSCLRSCQDIEDDLVRLGWDEQQKLVAYCTGGIRSGFFWSVTSHCGVQQALSANYGGSMWEWASDTANVLCTGGERFCFPTAAPTLAPTPAPTSLFAATTTAHGLVAADFAGTGSEEPAAAMSASAAGGSAGGEATSAGGEATSSSAAPMDEISGGVGRRSAVSGGREVVVAGAAGGALALWAAAAPGSW